MITIDLKRKKALVFGVANEKSLAWAIAKKLDAAGAQVALTYQERNKDNVLPLKNQLTNPVFIECDVRYDESVEKCFETIHKEFRTFDFLVHSIAFTKKENLKGKFFDVSRKDFSMTQEVSAFSLVAITKKAYPLMNEEGSIMALTTIMSDRVFENYNVMAIAKAALNSSIKYLAKDVGDKKIRVNGISAGPILTGAASAIEGFDEIMKVYREKSPLKKDITPDDVANTALFLCSPLSRNITGHLLTVDAGYNIMGL